MKKFVIHAGNVKSNVDGQTHYIPCTTLVQLYRVNPDECIMIPSEFDSSQQPETRGYTKEFIDSLKHLYPRQDGNYMPQKPDTAIIYKAYTNEFGSLYVAFIDGNIRRSHVSSSDGWAKSEDIVPTVRNDFGVEPVWMADEVNNYINDQYNELWRNYHMYVGENDNRMTFSFYCDMVANGEME